MESRKTVLAALETQMERTCRHSLKRRGWDERRSGMETHALPCVKQTPVGICCMVQGAQPLLCDNLEGWDREGGGGRLKREGTHVYL